MVGTYKERFKSRQNDVINTYLVFVGVNPISTRGAHYAHHITTCPSGFSDIATALLKQVTMSTDGVAIHFLFLSMSVNKDSIVE